MKKVVIGLVILVALLGVAYAVLTSSGFIKSVVLPKVGTALNAQVTAESVALSPFSSLELRRVSVTPNGADPLASVELARVRYSLFAILRGRLEISEIQVTAPAVTVVRNADGSSNLDPILKALAAQPAPAQPASAKTSKPVQLDLASLKIENARLSYLARSADRVETSAEIAGLAITARDLRNGGKGKLEVGAGFKMAQRSFTGPNASAAAPGAPTAQAEGQLMASLDLELTPDLLPATALGRAEGRLDKASGTFADLQGLALLLQADATPTELRTLALNFSRQGAALGSITAKGPLDLAKKEAQLSLDLAAIDRNVLNLVGAPLGLDFTTTRFDSTNRIVLASAGQSLNIVGSITGSQVAVRKGTQTMPPVDLRDSYSLAVDLARQAATLQSFALSARQGGREVLVGSLAQPMQLSWSANAGPLPDASLKLLINDLRLADWSPLIGTPLQGSLKAETTLGVKNNGKDLALDTQAALAGFSGTFASNQVRNLGLQLGATLDVGAFADPAQRRLAATVKLDNLTGNAAGIAFERYGLDARANLGLPAGLVEIRQLDLAARQGTAAGGTASLTGQWNLEKPSGKISLTARDWNENGLRPFLQVALGEQQLRSIQLAASAALDLAPSGDLTVKADADCRNLIVRDPAGKRPETPLAAGLALDASGSSQRLNLRQAQIKLTPTQRAQNIASLTGELDFSRTNALKGNLSLTSDSLDITAYYDLYAGAPAPAPKPASNEPAPPLKGPESEPDPIQLPVELLTANLKVGKFFLREVAAENIIANLKITPSTVELHPLQLSLNGAPIAGDLDLNLGVPGFQYALKLTADAIPVKPLANSFVPLLKGRIDGTADAGIEIKGAGITGTSLQKSLAGGMNFAITNANLSLNDPAARKGMMTILIDLLAGALNIRELRDQPIMEIQARAALGAGKIDLTQANFRSSSLEAGTQGAIPIAKDLFQSPLNFPVSVALRRDLAARAKLLSADTPTNAVYAPIPTIASLEGTLGAPTPKVDKVKAGLLAARGLAGMVGGGATNVVSGVVNLIGGGATATTNAVGNLIQGIGNLIRGGKSDPAPAAPAAPTSTNTPAPASTNAAAPAKEPLGGLLRNLLEPKPDQPKPDQPKQDQPKQDQPAKP